MTIDKSKPTYFEIYTCGICFKPTFQSNKWDDDDQLYASCKTCGWHSAVSNIPSCKVTDGIIEVKNDD